MMVSCKLIFHFQLVITLLIVKIQKEVILVSNIQILIVLPNQLCIVLIGNLTMEFNYRHLVNKVAKNLNYVTILLTSYLNK